MSYIINRDSTPNSKGEIKEKIVEFFFTILLPVFFFLFLIIFPNPISIAVLIMWALVIKNRLSVRREKRAVQEVVCNTPPDNLRPIELFYLYSDNVSFKMINISIDILFFLIKKGDISMEIIDNKNGSESGTYLLKKAKSKSSETLREYEEFFIDFLFEKEESIYWNDFLAKTSKKSIHYSRLTFEIIRELQKRGYFQDFKGVDSVKNEDMGAYLFKNHFFKALKNIGKGALYLRTEKGKRLMPRIIGYINYLKKIERDRIIFHADPDKKSIYISDMMPYAVSLGVYKEWKEELTSRIPKRIQER